MGWVYGAWSRICAARGSSMPRAEAKRSEKAGSSSASSGAAGGIEVSAVKGGSARAEESGLVDHGSTQSILDLDFVRGLIAAVDDSGIETVELSRGGTRVRVSKTPDSGPLQAMPVYQQAPFPAAAPVPVAETPAPAGAATSAPAAEAEAPVPAGPELVEVKSPMVGTFYRAPAPEAPPYVEVGSRVSFGQTLCILEAMKLMNELESEMSGIVREILVENAEPVEFGQVLFCIEPTGS